MADTAAPVSTALLGRVLEKLGSQLGKLLKEREEPLLQRVVELAAKCADLEHRCERHATHLQNLEKRVKELREAQK